MSKIVLLPSLAKDYLTEKFAWRRNIKFISALKFATTFFVLTICAGLYAYHTTASSTDGYFLEEAKDDLAELEFSKKIEELDVIRRKKDLRAQTNTQYSQSWFDWVWSNMVTVNTYNSYVYRD